MKRISILAVLLAAVLVVTLAAVAIHADEMGKAKAAPAAEKCSDHGVTPKYGPNVPYQSSQWINGKCWCGAKDGVTPKQAQDAGWYASCDNGQCICNYAPGTVASNACCMPPKKS